MFVLGEAIVFNATFNSISAISWRSVLLVEETGVPGEHHRPVANHWAGFELTTLVVIGTDCIGNESNGIRVVSPRWPVRPGSFRPDDLFAPGRFAPESESIRPEKWVEST